MRFRNKGNAYAEKVILNFPVGHTFLTFHVDDVITHYERQVHGYYDVGYICRKLLKQGHLERVHTGMYRRVTSPHRHGEAAMIYVASKTRHAQLWKDYRMAGFPIVSTWIDEAGEGESECLTDLWKRCIKESSECSALVAYAEPGDVWKGAFIEIGSALASGKIVFAVGCDPELSFLNHPNARLVGSLSEAMNQAVILSSPLPTVEGEGR